MKIQTIFSKGIIRYIVYCYVLLACALGFMVLFGGGGHGPFLGRVAIMMLVFLVATFPASLISILGFATGGYPEVLVPLLIVIPLLNALFWGWYLHWRKKHFKISKKAKGGAEGVTK